MEVLATVNQQLCKLAKIIAETWFTDNKTKNEVAEILRRFHLDKSAIEAQAIKRLASELEILDKRLMSLEARRNRAIRNIAEYRESFARKVRREFRPDHRSKFSS